jgi:ketosteroid isomerase-like protein
MLTPKLHGSREAHTSRAMRHEGIERLRPVYAEWARGNFGVGGELFADDMVFRAFDTFEDEDLTVRGPEGVRGFMRQFLQQWDDLRIEARSFTAHGDKVLVGCEASGIGKRSGARVGMEIFAVWTFDGERVFEVRWLRDRGTAREAADLAPDA